MSATYPKVVSALTAAFQTVNDASLDLPVQWPNMAVVPPSDGPWASFDILPSEPRVATLGVRGEDEFTGVAQITLNYPLQKGTKEINAAYETLRAFFVAGKFLTFEDTSVTVLQCGITPPRKSDSTLKCFVSVYWRARIQRPTIT